MRNLKKTLLNITLVVAVLLVPAVVFGATTVGNDVSVGGTLSVTGATTFNGAVTLGDAAGDDITVTGYVASNIIPKTNNAYDLGAFVNAYNDVFASGTMYANTFYGGTLTATSTVAFNGAVTLGDATTDSITATGYFLTNLSVGNGTTTTSTLGINSLALAKAANFDVGKFYVDSSGNVSASGTLGIAGTTSLNGHVNLGDAATDYIVSTAYFRNSLSVGNGETATTTFGANFMILGQVDGSNVGKFYVDGAGAVSASSTIQTLQTATSTVIIDTTDTTKGTCFVVRDVAGTRKFMTILPGNTVGISAVDCRI